MAIKGSDCPIFTVLLAGVTVIEESVAGGITGLVTVSTVVPEMLPSWALMVLVPAARACAKPELLIVAVGAELLDQVGTAQAWLEPSVKPQVAINCNGLPATTLGLAGVTVIVESTAEQVCVVASDVSPSWVAVIELVPVPMQSISRVVVSVPTCAIVGEALENTAPAVTSRVLPSL